MTIKVLGYSSVYVDDLLIARKCPFNDTLIATIKEIWKSSTLEHLSADPDCAPILRFGGSNLERINTVWSRKLSLPEGTILVNTL